MTPLDILLTNVQVDEVLHVEQLACEELFFWPKVAPAAACLTVRSAFGLLHILSNNLKELTQL